MQGFDWTDGAWRGLPLRRYIFYELHVGTFTPEGTFDGVADHLDDLAALGVTAVELMPVAQFPGERNWGYDGVYPFAVQELLRRPGRAEAAGRRLPPAGPGCRSRRRLQPPRTGGQLPRGLRPLLFRSTTAPPGGRRSISTAPTATRCAGSSSKTPSTGSPSSISMPCAWTRSTPYWTFPPTVPAGTGRAVHLKSSEPGSPGLSHRRKRLERHPADPPRRTGGIWAWTPSGTTIFTTPCTRCSPENARAITGISGSSSSCSRRCGRGLSIPASIPNYRKRRHGNSSRDIPADRFVVFAQNHDQVGNRMTGRPAERAPSRRRPSN